MFAKELTDEEVRVWSDFLREFSMGELRFAFDNWTRNGRFFPKPRDIADQCEAFRITQKNQLGYPDCDDLCKSQHWKGYGINDVKWVLKHYLEEIERGGLRTPVDFFTELDTKREGGAPVWKR